jgi:hypothetical protein
MFVYFLKASPDYTTILIDASDFIYLVVTYMLHAEAVTYFATKGYLRQH